ncbi:DNA mismatch repair protein MSH1, mitochondrial isoform X1 [Tripterygium wilfordii]|uniref:DNA mismatch repair protein MSH1, mitochondrial isoform X1 n=3 Tax=Tripterygium wilfordii TaxID=458696 RepID=UPI0018F82BF3|nr:DNA mismatch repair protein MSH1, mitochondrial isoform X1 [Tripterygium wilfordii]
MYWLATRNVVVSFPKWRSLAFLLRRPASRYCSFTPSPLQLQLERIRCFRDHKVLKETTRSAKKQKAWKSVLNDKDLSNIEWWKERLQICRKPSTVQLVKKISYSNLLGLDVNLKNGKLKEGNLNWEMLQFKSKFPREVLLCRVGEFYEAIGMDACILVEYAGLNPFGGLRSDSVPRAGCPVVNLRQTLDDLTRNGFSVCIVEEVQGPTQARSRKDRFISGHAHPGSPYVYGLVAVDHDLDFPEPMPVVGISRSARGYCITSVFETLKTYSSEDGLTEEALVTKLRTCRDHHLFLHKSLKNNSSGTCRWGEFGEGGLLWGECSARHFEWIEGDPVTELLFKVKELYGLEEAVTFRNVTVSSENRPRSLHLGTATQIGVIPTEGIPCLLKVLLPPDCKGLPVLYIRDLLLNPPAYEIATRIQATCKLMSQVACSIPGFTCVSSAKLVKLLELREANHIEFCRIKDVLDEILHMYRNSELNEILKLLMDPTWVATGLKIDFETLIDECEWASGRICELISLEGEHDQKICSSPIVPREFFEDMESLWKGRVKRIHIEEEFAEAERAAKALSLAVTEDFLPIISRIKATTAPLGGPKGEILYAREHESVWFKGRRFIPSVWAGTQGEEQIKQLKPAIDSKGKRVGEEWFTTKKVEDALIRYHEAGEKAKARVWELLRGLSAELQTKINILVFASMLLVIAKALFAHVSEGRRRKWVFPALTGFEKSKDVKSLDGANGMKLVGLSPYWFDVAEGSAVHNTVDMQSLFLLTGPNGGGKSSLLRSICAAALLGICGFMVPAESAVIPHLDSIMLHMKSYDSPADGKSSFQVEMSEMRSIITGASSKSLVLIDEICRGTETAKGTCIAGSIVETLDKIGCLGIISTHLHGIFSLPLKTKNTTHKAMGTECVDGHTKPTWKLIDGVCRESLAFETGRREGLPETVIQRAEELYFSVFSKKELSGKIDTSVVDFCSDIGCNGYGSESCHSLPSSTFREAGCKLSHSTNSTEVLQKEVENAIVTICQKKLIELYKPTNTSKLALVQCVIIAAREQPPPSTIGASSVYIMLRPDKKLYVGQTDDLEGRIRAHRSKEGMQNATFIYFLLPGKSLACQMETLLINQLPDKGFHLANVADGKHRHFGTSNISLDTMTVR